MFHGERSRVPNRRDPRLVSRRREWNQEHFLGGGIVAHCSGQGNTLTAAAPYYGVQGLLHLIGNVHYTEPRLTVIRAP